MLRRRLLLVVLGAVLILPALSGWVQAATDHPASTPGWRPVAQVGPPKGVTSSGGLIATSASNAWSTWSDCNPCGTPSKQDNWIERWTGRAWRRVTVPAAVTRFLTVTDGIAATSADDLWMFTVGRAAHWNGKHWGITKIPSWVVRFNLAGEVNLTVGDFGPTNLWAFSSGVGSFKPGRPFAARYDGHNWRKVRLPGFPGEVSVVGPDDIWAVGFPGLTGRPFLMHWNGRSWSKLAMPKPREVPAHFTAFLMGLTAFGQRDVWLLQDIMKGEFFQRTELFLHWNGRAWQTVHYPWPTSDVQTMASDGHGGLWLSDVGEGRQQPKFLVHDSTGKWTRQLVPAPARMAVLQVLTLTLIPGTRSLWATGETTPPGNTTALVGAIWKYGP